MRIRITLATLAVLLGFAAASLAATSLPKPYRLTSGTCRHGYTGQLRTLKQQSHGKTIKVREFWCVPVAATSVTPTVTVTKPFVVTETQTTTVTTPQPAPTTPLTLSGNGSENLGPINVTQPSTLHWSCSSCSNDNFIITNSPNDAHQIDVNALDATSGQTYVDPGTYNDVSVNTEGGDWTITIDSNY
jgi:hypothetical protein